MVQLADGVETLDFAEMVAFLEDTGLMTQRVPEQLEYVPTRRRAALARS